MSVIWLHGLGADGNDFVPIVPHLQIPQRCSIRFVFPHAPIRPITINMGMRMRAWYDITHPALGERQEDHEGVKNSAKIVNDLINHEIQLGLTTKQIVLAGFFSGRGDCIVFCASIP